jgi:hypothetical protein
MTEQNYVDPGQSQPTATVQMESLLVRIAQLEAEVRKLRDQVELAQGGKVITFPS